MWIKEKRLYLINTSYDKDIILCKDLYSRELGMAIIKGLKTTDINLKYGNEIREVEIKINKARLKDLPHYKSGWERINSRRLSKTPSYSRER